MNQANVVNVSGGKDSTATLLLAIEREAPNLSAVFADTGHEHPATYEYLDYLEGALGLKIRRVRACFKMRIANKREYIMKKWAADGVPEEHIREALETLVVTGIPMLDLAIWKGRFPSPKARFCTEELKVAPMMDQVFIPMTKAYDQVISWQGVRRDESSARAVLNETEEGEFGVINYRPILDWSADDCFQMHRKHGIKWNPLYEQGMGRVGCMPCIMARKAELAEIEKRFPQEFDRLARWERLVTRATKRGATTFFDGRIPAAILNDDNIRPETHGVGFWREYASTARGGRQRDLLTEMEKGEAPVCHSIYGLCE
jgi:3'-phosphoadenosine 5'-phosphosulfate sulfotransferase (PAPS reductase)/FAD synthetase